jgi:hypothetical protein
MMWPQLPLPGPGSCDQNIDLSPQVPPGDLLLGGQLAQSFLVAHSGEGRILLPVREDACQPAAADLWCSSSGRAATAQPARKSSTRGRRPARHRASKRSQVWSMCASHSGDSPSEFGSLIVHSMQVGQSVTPRSEAEPLTLAQATSLGHVFSLRGLWQDFGERLPEVPPPRSVRSPCWPGATVDNLASTSGSLLRTAPKRTVSTLYAIPTIGELAPGATTERAPPGANLTGILGNQADLLTLLADPQRGAPFVTT